MRPRLEELESVCVCMCVGGGSSRKKKGVGWGGGENDSKHICPRFVCSNNTKPQHGPVQISFKCTTGCLQICCQTLGKSLSPHYDGSPCLGNTNIDSVGINKQVADAWITALAASVRRSQGNQENIRLAASQMLPSSCDHLSSRYHPGRSLTIKLLVQCRHERCYCTSSSANVTDQEKDKGRQRESEVWACAMFSLSFPITHWRKKKKLLS